MSVTTPPTASPQTTLDFTRTGLPSSIPYFTPESGCLASTNIWRYKRFCVIGSGLEKDQGWCDIFLWDYNGGTQALPTSQIATKECYPRQEHAATRCPESYTSVGRDSVTVAGDGGNDLLQEAVYCCPEVYSFDITTSPTFRDQEGSMATIDATECVATNPSFDGNNPFTLTVSSWSTASDYAHIFTTETATFDTDSDVLFASMVTVQYEVIPSLDVTCAPNCEDPWTGGGWPKPTEYVPSDSGPPRSDSSLRGLAPFMISMIALGCSVAVLIIIGVTCCLVRRRRRKNMKEAIPAARMPDQPQVGSDGDMASQKGKKTANDPL